MLRFILTPFLRSDPPAGGGPAPPAVPPAADPARRVDDFTTRMIAQHGTLENAMRAASLRALTAEDTVSTHERTIADYRTRLPEGAVVLPKVEAEAFAKLQALGKVDDIIAGMKERDTLKGKQETFEATERARGAAPGAGLDAEAFVAYALREKLPIEMRDAPTKVNGRTVTAKMPFVRAPGDEKAAWVPLNDFVALLPAHEQRALRPGGAAPVGPPPVATYPRQAPAVVGAPTDAVADFISKRDARNAARPSPLFPNLIPVVPSGTGAP